MKLTDPSKPEILFQLTVFEELHADYMFLQGHTAKKRQYKNPNSEAYDCITDLRDSPIYVDKIVQAMWIGFLLFQQEK
jgi:hypothetical protein